MRISRDLCKWTKSFGCLVTVTAHGEFTPWDCLYVSDTIQLVAAIHCPLKQSTLLEEDAFPAPWSNLHRSLPHRDRGLHSLPGLAKEPPAGFLPLLCGAGGDHACPGALLGNEQQKFRKPSGAWPRVSTLSWQRLHQLPKPCPLQHSRKPLPRVPVGVYSQVGVWLTYPLLCTVQSGFVWQLFFYLVARNQEVEVTLLIINITEWTMTVNYTLQGNTHCCHSFGLHSTHVCFHSKIHS